MKTLAAGPAVLLAGWTMAAVALGASGEEILKDPRLSAEDPFMGEYLGSGLISSAGSPMAVEAKVWPVKEGYRAALMSPPCTRGPTKTRIDLQGAVQGGKLVLAGKAGDAEWKAEVAEKELTAKSSQGGNFNLSYSVRRPTTLGQEPPKGAMVLLPFEEGKPPSLNEWTNQTWQALPDGSMVKGKGNTSTRRAFGDVRLHLEFSIPYEPNAGGQGRGNSGVYLQGRYEVQVLDSFGLVPAKGDCGAIYGIAVPKINACLPPLAWQTYDITFRALWPKAGGKDWEPAVMTIRHNGILIHKNQPVPRTTTAGVGGGPRERTPLMLQDHGHLVRYRNIWLLEGTGEPEEGEKASE